MAFFGKSNPVNKQKKKPKEVIANVTSAAACAAYNAYVSMCACGKKKNKQKNWKLFKMWR